MKKTSYSMIVYRFGLVRDKNERYRGRGIKKSRDRIKFKHQRPERSTAKEHEIHQGIKQALHSGEDVRLLLFGYFQSQQLIGQITEYQKEMQIILVHTEDRTEWIDTRDIIDIDLDV